MPKRKNLLIQPFMKWVGGKRQLLDIIKKHLPKNINRYYEPFVGGGALLFELQKNKSTINDNNSELINLYRVVKNQVEELIEELKKFKNEEKYFYTIRNLDRTKEYEKLSDVQKAARIHYLNKTCFNGMFRVNNAGEFNAPFGRYKNPNIINEIRFRAINKYLNNNDIKILNGDFENSLKEIKKGDFVYFDPPYDPVSNSSNFTGYTKNGFDREQQKRLKKVCDYLNEKKIKFLLSNSDTDFIKNLYKNYKINIIQAKRSINCKSKKRGAVNELLIKNYE
jgi:DNA adenine methylase